MFDRCRVSGQVFFLADAADALLPGLHDDRRAATAIQVQPIQAGTVFEDVARHVDVCAEMRVERDFADVIAAFADHM